MKPCLLFVYGTLRAPLGPSGPPSRHALILPATRVGAGSFQGKLYSLGEYPGAVASEDPADAVRGEVYELHDPEVTIARLDVYEGCSAEDPAPRHFERTIGEVRLETGEVVRALMYLYVQETAKRSRIEGGDFLAFACPRRAVRVS